MAETTPGLDLELGITLNRLVKQVAAAEARMVKMAQDVERRLGKTDKRVFSGMPDSARRAARQSEAAFSGMGTRIGRSLQGSLRNTSLQLSQVAQQAAATGDPIRALAIQLPDLGLAFGTVGIAAGAVAGALVPLAINFLRAGGGAEELEDRAKALTEAVNAYSEAASAARTPTADLQESYRSVATEARGFLEALQEIAEFRGRAAASSQFEAFSESLGEAFSFDFQGSLEDVQAFREQLLSEIERLATEAQDTIDTKLAIRLDVEREGLESQVEALDTYAESVDALAERFGIAQEDAAALGQALNALATAEGLRSEVEAAAVLKTELDRIFGTVSAMPEPIRDFYAELSESAAKAAELQGDIEGAENALQGMVSAISAASSGLSGLTDQAGDLWANMKAAADEAWRYVGAQGAELKQQAVGGSDRAREAVRDEFLPSGQRREDIVSQRTFPARSSAAQSGGGSAGASGGGAAKAPFDLFEDIEREIVAASSTCPELLEQSCHKL